MSTTPPAAIPGPEDVPPEQRKQHQQPDPFGELTDEAGGAIKHREDVESDPDEDTENVADTSLAEAGRARSELRARACLEVFIVRGPAVVGWVAFIAAVLVCVAACTGSDRTAGNMSTSPPIPAAGPSTLGSSAADPGEGAVVSPNGKPSSTTPDNAQTIAQAAGCQDVRFASIAQTSDAVHCFIGASSVDVVSFPTAAERDSFISDSGPGSSTIRVGQSGPVYWAALATDGSSTDLQPFGGSPLATPSAPTTS